jgi:hypothetical protein
LTKKVPTIRRAEGTRTPVTASEGERLLLKRVKNSAARNSRENAYLILTDWRERVGGLEMHGCGRERSLHESQDVLEVAAGPLGVYICRLPIPPAVQRSWWVGINS